jgi:hypothetical protein
MKKLMIIAISMNLVIASAFGMERDNVKNDAIAIASLIHKVAYENYQMTPQEREMIIKEGNEKLSDEGRCAGFISLYNRKLDKVIDEKKRQRLKNGMWDAVIETESLSALEFMFNEGANPNYRCFLRVFPPLARAIIEYKWTWTEQQKKFVICLLKRREVRTDIPYAKDSDWRREKQWYPSIFDWIQDNPEIPAEIKKGSAMHAFEKEAVNKIININLEKPENSD